MAEKPDNLCRHIMTFFLNRNNVFNSTLSSGNSPTFDNITVTGTADINNLVVNNETVTNLNATTAIIPTLTTREVFSTGSIIEFFSPISFGLRNGRELFVSPYVFASPEAAVTTFATTNGTLGNFVAGTGTFTPAVDGFYSITFSSSFNVGVTGPSSGTGFPSFNVRILKNTSPSLGACASLPWQNSVQGFVNQFSSMSASWIGRLIPGTDSIQFFAGISRDGGADGTNSGSLHVGITFLG